MVLVKAKAISTVFHTLMHLRYLVHQPVLKYNLA